MFHNLRRSVISTIIALASMANVYGRSDPRVITPTEPSPRPRPQRRQPEPEAVRKSTTFHKPRGITAQERRRRQIERGQLTVSNGLVEPNLRYIGHGIAEYTGDVPDLHAEKPAFCDTSRDGRNLELRLSWARYTVTR